MAVRAVLLILVVGVFMTIWSEDHNRPEPQRAGKTLQPSRTHTSTRKAGPTQPALEPVAGARQAVSVEPAVPGVEALRPAESGRQVGQAFQPAESGRRECLPHVLPFTIVPGEYRVVCSDGRVWTLMLTDDDLRANGIPRAPDAPLDVYEFCEGPLRWYFIRIQMPRPGSNPPQFAADRAPVAAPRPEPAGDSPDWAAPRWLVRVGSTLDSVQLEVLRTTDRVRNSIRRWFNHLDIRDMFIRLPARLSRGPKAMRR